MAKTQQSEKQSENVNPPAPSARPPAGFSNEGRPDIDGWLKPSEGLVVWGVIAGFFSFTQRNRDGTTKVRDVLCVRLLQPMLASKEGGEMVQLEKGQTLAMSMMYALEPLRVYVEHRGQVWVQFKTKAPLGGGQFVWKADVFGKGEKAAAPPPTFQAPAPNLPPSDTNGSADDDPFAESWST